MDHKDPILCESVPFRERAVFRVINFRCIGNKKLYGYFTDLLHARAEDLLYTAAVLGADNYVANPKNLTMRCVSIN